MGWFIGLRAMLLSLAVALGRAAGQRAQTGGLIAAQGAVTPPPPPPPLYTLMNEALSWSDASAACLEAGLQLASVRSAAENALLVTAAAGNKVWIGGTDAASDGTWVWSPSDSPLSYTNWHPGEPNNEYNQDCLLFNFDAFGKWDDNYCTLKFKYVCQVPPPPPPSSPSPPPPSPSPPKSFLDLHYDAYSSANSSNGRVGSCIPHYDAGDLDTEIRWTKLAWLDEDLLQINALDTTYATIVSGSGNLVAYVASAPTVASAYDCAGWGSARGEGVIDLRGTPYAIAGA